MEWTRSERPSLRYQTKFCAIYKNNGEDSEKCLNINISYNKKMISYILSCNKIQNQPHQVAKTYLTK